MLMELVNQLEESERTSLVNEYETYAKNAIKNNKHVLMPEVWLQDKDIIKKVDERNKKTRLAFWQLMIDNGHGDIIQRARFQVKGY